MKTLTKEEMELREEYIKAFIKQGFKINPHISPKSNDKITYKSIQLEARNEYLNRNKKFLLKYLSEIASYSKKGIDIIPGEIDLELRLVSSGTFEEIIFKWWNLVWWSIPYQRPYGRQMRFLIWDKTHNTPFGLICLQSPVLKMAVRDNTLQIPKEELDIWVNRSMNAHRVGALPPYNELLGGKMVALALVSNEIRDAYKNKYKNYTTIIKKRYINPELLFITTTSAFGKSSLYNRLKYNGRYIAELLGYTRGSGSFHIPEELYQKTLKILSQKGVDIARGFGHGSSKKLKLISLGLKYLGLSKYEYHGIKRAFYLFPLVENLREVITQKEKPIYLNYSFNELMNYWKERWCLPRAERIKEWRNFSPEKYFKNVKEFLNEL